MVIILSKNIFIDTFIDLTLFVFVVSIKIMIGNKFAASIVSLIINKVYCFMDNPFPRTSRYLLNGKSSSSTSHSADKRKVTAWPLQRGTMCTTNSELYKAVQWRNVIFGRITEEILSGFLRR